MTPEWQRWFSNLALFGLTVACAHLVMSCGQTLMRHWLGHHGPGGRFFRNHINFHHNARSHLAYAVYRGTDGDNTPFCLIPIILAGVAFRPAAQSILNSRDSPKICGIDDAEVVGDLVAVDTPVPRPSRAEKSVPHE